MRIVRAITCNKQEIVVLSLICWFYALLKKINKYTTTNHYIIMILVPQNSTQSHPIPPKRMFLVSFEAIGCYGHQESFYVSTHPHRLWILMSEEGEERSEAAETSGEENEEWQLFLGVD